MITSLSELSQSCSINKWLSMMSAKGFVLSYFLLWVSFWIEDAEKICVSTFCWLCSDLFQVIERPNQQRTLSSFVIISYLLSSSFQRCYTRLVPHLYIWCWVFPVVCVGSSCTKEIWFILMNLRCFGTKDPAWQWIQQFKEGDVVDIICPTPLPS